MLHILRLPKAAVEAVLPFVSVRSTMPVLSHIKFESTGAHVVMTASNVDTQIRYTFDCAGDQMEACIDAQALKRFAGFCGDDDVTLKITDNKAALSCKASKARLSVLPAQEFPILEKRDGIIAELDWVLLRDKFAFSALFCNEGDVRPQMNCLMVTSTGTRIDIFGTTGGNLGLESLNHISSQFGICIPVGSVRNMTGNFTSLIIRDEHIELKGPNAEALFKLAPYKPVEARKLLSASLPNACEVSRQSMLEAVLFASAFKDNAKLRGVIQIDHGSVKNIGQNEADSPYECKGDELSIHAYPDDFSKFLKSLTSDSIAIQFDAKNNILGQVRLIDGSKTIITMPVRA